MAHRQRTRRKVGTYFLGQFEQADEVRDGAAVLADRRGDLFLREGELIGQPLISDRFVQRIEVLALDVLDQRELEQLLI